MSLKDIKPTNAPERPTAPSQAQESAEAKALHTKPTVPVQWHRPSNLPEIPARPGYVQRWIRTRLLNEDDTRNVSVRFREGWQPRDPKSVPEGYAPPTITHGQHAGYIGVEGLILCEMPEEVFAQIKAWVKARTREQTEAIDQNILRVQQGSPGIPITVDRQSTVTTGRRPKVDVASD